MFPTLVIEYSFFFGYPYNLPFCKPIIFNPLDKIFFTNTTFWGRRPTIKAQTLIGGIPGKNHYYLVYNLLHDPKDLLSLDDKELGKRMNDGAKRICEGFDGSKSKTLLSESYCFKDSQFAEIGIDELRKRANFIKNNEELCSRLINCIWKTKKV